MPNDGTGTNWDEVDPEDTDLVPAGAKEIRDLRIATRQRIAKEHVSPAAAGVGGEHSAGSAKGYYGGAAPTTRPDGTALGVADAGRVWADGTIWKVWSGAAWVAMTGVTAGIAAAVINQTIANGTGGGAFTSGAWRTRALNTEFDPAGIVTIAANQFTLAAGTYYIRAALPAFRVAAHVGRLQNITDGTTTLVGTAEYSGNSPTGALSRSIVEGTFVIAGAKTFELQHRCETTSALSSGLGYPLLSWGVSEVHTTANIIKL